jgi:hypothetical protein
MNIIYALEEDIGNPELFTGRIQLMNHFVHWVDLIRKKLGKSRALLSRKKKGKTALLQRLYNITWTQNDVVAPFYYEIKEKEISLFDFADDFLTSFLTQYFAFKTRDPELLRFQYPLSELQKVFKRDKAISKGLNIYQIHRQEDNDEAMWEIARKFPHGIAFSNNDIRVLQMIDEFQNINKYILDKDKEPIKTLAGSYLRTAESKVAPLLVTGSYIGWLRRIIWGQLTARFSEFHLENLETEEALEAIYKYSDYHNLPVGREVAAYILNLSQGDPYYISILFGGNYLGKKDFQDMNNIIDVYDYQIKNGEIRDTWLEYLYFAFDEINNLNSKRIVLYLFNANGEERTRQQILDDLKLDMTDGELEKKLKALVQADIISQGQNNFRYKISQDKIYELVFRNIYQEEIDKVGKEIKTELKREMGKLGYHWGHFVEYMFERKLCNGFNLQDVSYNGKDRHILIRGEVYRNYIVKLNKLKNMEIDIYGHLESGEEIFIEVKSGQRKTGAREIEKYIRFKKNLEQQTVARPAVILIYSLAGFTESAVKKLAQSSIYYGDEDKFSFM